MYCIVLSLDEIGTRLETIRLILAPLRGNLETLTVRRETVRAAGSLTWSASDRGFEQLGPLFKTAVNGMYGSYHERWNARLAGLKPEAYVLERAYLTLYRKPVRSDEKPEEILCVHCDPLDCSYTPSPRMVKIKQAPHLHVVCADHPLSLIHI